MSKNLWRLRQIIDSHDTKITNLMGERQKFYRECSEKTCREYQEINFGILFQELQNVTLPVGLRSSDILTIIKQLYIPNRAWDETSILHSDLEIRKELLNFDRKIIEEVQKRMEVVREIGKHKQQQKIHEVIDRPRWTEIINTRLHEGKKLGISFDMIQCFFNALHQISVNVQKEISR